MRLLMIDNFDSFTYNLVQYLRELGATVEVVRNDTREPLAPLLERMDGLLVSPGPCAPGQAGISVEALKLVGSATGPRRPALGVCLGHQALAEAYGGTVVRAAAPMHGKTSPVWHDGSPPFGGIQSPTEVMRYHSLVVDPQRLPPELRVTARTTDGTIMGLAHKHLPIFGVQFHPESILTGDGKAMLRRFMDVVEWFVKPIILETQSTQIRAEYADSIRLSIEEAGARAARPPAEADGARVSRLSTEEDPRNASEKAEGSAPSRGTESSVELVGQLG